MPVMPGGAGEPGGESAQDRAANPPIRYSLFDLLHLSRMGLSTVA